MCRRGKCKTEKANIAVACDCSEKSACRIPPVDTDSFIQLKSRPGYYSTGSGATLVRMTHRGIKENGWIEVDRHIYNLFIRLGTLGKEHVLPLRAGQWYRHRA